MCVRGRGIDLCGYVWRVFERMGDVEARVCVDVDERLREIERVYRKAW